MLTRAELNAAKYRLLSLLDRLDREWTGLTVEAFGPGSEQGGGSDEARRPEEQGGIRLEDEVTLACLQNEEHLIAEIDAALARLGAGTYGLCVKCRRPISMRRLRAIPYAALCIDCARRPQQEAGG